MFIAFSRKLLLIMVLLGLMSGVPASAQYWNDATHLFKQETEWLADNVAKETKAEFQFNTNGFVAYADRKTPEVGDVETFTTCNILKNAPERIRAVLKKIGTHCYVYVEQGRKIEAKVLTRIASNFDKKILPEVHSMFGREWSPGIDGDKKITLLLLDIKDSYAPSKGRKGFTAGYFYAGDEYNKSKNANSNEREMLYLDVYPGNPSSDKFLSVIAHEFQHMVQWNNDPKEYDWVDESLSQLAPFLCGYGHPPQVLAFIRNPDNNLCAWSKENMLANYGQVYLWAYYISTHISTSDERRRSFVRKMVEQKSQGLSGLNAAIKKQGIKNNVANLFRSFCLANYLNDSSFARGAYGYDKNLAKLAIKPQVKDSSSPAKGKSSVKCWSAKAVQIESQSFIGQKVEVSFVGQKISAGKYSNNFDVAFVSWSKSRKSKPSVDWLAIRKFNASKVIKVPSEHDKMMLLVVNRGPSVMKVEQAYAKGAKAAAFSYYVGRTNLPIATTSARNRASSPGRSSSSTSRRRVSRSGARRMIDEIIAGPILEDSAGDILSQKDTSEQSASEVSFELAFQKISGFEDSLIEEVRAGIAEENFDFLLDFIEVYRIADEDGKVKLNSLKNRILDVLRFEEIQGNNKVSQFKTDLE